MAKQPDIQTIVDVWNDRDKINYNFKSIQAKFDTLLSRDGSTPNPMETDLDVADSTVTNTNIFKGDQLILNTYDILDYQDLLMYNLEILDYASGDIIYAPVDDTVDTLAIKADGKVLKVASGLPSWQDEGQIIGVTVEEDGVNVADNVTTLNFLWAGSVIATVPVSQQVDIDLSQLFAAEFEDSTQADTNINPDGPDATLFDDPAEVVRLDLINDVGLVAEPASDNLYYFIAETSNRVEDSVGAPAAQGIWGLGVRFFDNTGTATALTGNEITPPPGEVNSRSGTTDGGNMLTVYCGIPANTRYIDVASADQFLFPLFFTYALTDNRYRAVVSALAKAGGFKSPNDISYPGGVNASITPGP